MPLIGVLRLTTVNTLGHAYGAKWYDESLKPTLGTDPNWAKMLTWQKAMVDAVGYDKLQKFVAKLGGANSEFSAQNGFETGKIAMMHGRRVAQRLHRGRQVQGQLRHRAVPGRRRPARAVRLRADRRHHRRRPQGRQARGRVLAAAAVHDHRQHLPDDHGPRPQERAQHGRVAEGPAAPERPALQAVPRRSSPTSSSTFKPITPIGVSRLRPVPVLRPEVAGRARSPTSRPASSSSTSRSAKQLQLG